MKTHNLILTSFSLALALSGVALGQNPVPPPAKAAPQPAPKSASKGPEAKVAPAAPKEEATLRLNFRGVPLADVLKYFVDFVGYTVVPDTGVSVSGSVDVWSNQPLTKSEALDLLNKVLNQKGYAAIAEGKVLTIVTKGNAKTKAPVKSGSEPNDIPKTEEMITQIIPVKFISAAQLIRTLDALLPESASISANDGANAIVLVDTQVNIRRITEIVKALDTPISVTSAIRVFSLKYADAKALSTVVRDLFGTTQQDTQSRGGGGTGGTGGTSPFQQFFQSRGGGGPGGFGGGFGGGGGDTGSSGRGGGGTSGRGGSTGGRVSTPRVVASADELTNSLIVSAPEEQMTLIEEVVAKVDVPVEDVTELRVFKLKYANPTDTADMLKNLFPDPNSANNRGGSSSGRQSFFGGGGPGGFGGGGGPGGTSSRGTTGGTGSPSERMLKQNKVVAVADVRTTSVLVSASPVMMEQIAKMIEQLDSDPSKQQKVFVIPVENADPAQMQQILQNLFPSVSNNRSSQQTSGNRSGFGTGTTTRNNGGSSVGRTSGNSGFGGGGSGFGGGSSGFGGGSSGFGGSSGGGRP